MTSPAGPLPVRGPAVRELGLPLPPEGDAAVGPGAPPMALVRAGRPLKRWRYVAAFGSELMLCAGDARIGPLPQRWWAVVRRGSPLVGRTSLGRAGLSLESAPSTRLRIASNGVRVDLEIADDCGSRPVEVASPSEGGGWIWTRKRVGLPARGTVELSGHSGVVELEGVIDDSAGYHARRTAWRWSTGVGRAESGQRVGWNLVSGVHDSPNASERALWVDGEPTEPGPATFADDLSAIRFDGGELRFRAWAAREHRSNLLLVRSRYRQPFGIFGGELPDGLRLAEGYGVMEEHDVRW